MIFLIACLNSKNHVKKVLRLDCLKYFITGFTRYWCKWINSASFDIFFFNFSWMFSYSECRFVTAEKESFLLVHFLICFSCPCRSFCWLRILRIYDQFGTLRAEEVSLLLLVFWLFFFFFDLLHFKCYIIRCANVFISLQH